MCYFPKQASESRKNGGARGREILVKMGLLVHSLPPTSSPQTNL